MKYIIENGVKEPYDDEDPSLGHYYKIDLLDGFYIIHEPDTGETYLATDGSDVILHHEDQLMKMVAAFNLE